MHFPSLNDQFIQIPLHVDKPMMLGVIAIKVAIAKFNHTWHIINKNNKQNGQVVNLVLSLLNTSFHFDISPFPHIHKNIPPNNFLAILLAVATKTTLFIKNRKNGEKQQINTNSNNNNNVKL